MKLIIDIPDEIYNYVISSGILCENELFQSLLLGVRYGTSLPKGHGDLIDRDALEKDTEWNDHEDWFTAYSQSQIINATVVVPADKGDT